MTNKIIPKLDKKTGGITFTGKPLEDRGISKIVVEGDLDVPSIEAILNSVAPVEIETPKEIADKTKMPAVISFNKNYTFFEVYDEKGEEALCRYKKGSRVDIPFTVDPITLIDYLNLQKERIKFSGSERNKGDKISIINHAIENIYGVVMGDFM